MKLGMQKHIHVPVQVQIAILEGKMYLATTGITCNMHQNWKPLSTNYDVPIYWQKQHSCSIE